MRLAENRRLGDLAGDASGAALAEFALVSPIFFALLIGLLQLGLLGMMSANFQTATESVSRRIRTGQADKPPTAAEFRNLICARMVDVAADCKSRMRVSVQPVNTFAVADGAVQGQDPGAVTGAQAYDTGAAEQVMLVTATYSWPLAIPFVTDAFIRDGAWNVLIVSRISFRNEPFE